MGDLIRINTRTLKRIINRIERKCGVVSLDDFMSHEFQHSDDKHVRVFRNCVWALQKKRS